MDSGEEELHMQLIQKTLQQCAYKKKDDIDRSSHKFALLVRMHTIIFLSKVHSTLISLQVPAKPIQIHSAPLLCYALLLSSAALLL